MTPNVKLAIVITTGLAFFYTGYAAGQPSAQAPERQFTLTISQSELPLLGKALGLLPFNEVVGLMTKLQAQVAEQQLPTPTANTPSNATTPSKP